MLAVATALLSCSPPPPDNVVSVTTLTENIVAWDGEHVTVEGWLGKCAGFECHIFATVADMNIISRGDYQSDEWGQSAERSISIGSTEEFDRLAESLQYSFVKLRARVDKTCWEGLCTDRASVLHPISVSPVVIEGRAN
jgi:hypothetical protein